MNSVISETITFKEIERTFFEIGCEVSRGLMASFLKTVDQEICETRNKEEFRHKGGRSTGIKTLMGEVPIKRVLYEKTGEDGTSQYIFLLDKELGFETIGNISPNLVEKIASQICEMSFREAAKTISDLTNQSISHQGVWNVVQAIGERQKDAEKCLMNDFKDGYLSGDKKVPILFEEADGYGFQFTHQRNTKPLRRWHLQDL